MVTVCIVKFSFHRTETHRPMSDGSDATYVSALEQEVMDEMHPQGQHPETRRSNSISIYNKVLLTFVLGQFTDLKF